MVWRDSPCPGAAANHPQPPWPPRTMGRDSPVAEGEYSKPREYSWPERSLLCWLRDAGAGMLGQDAGAGMLLRDAVPRAGTAEGAAKAALASPGQLKFVFASSCTLRAQGQRVSKLLQLEKEEWRSYGWK